MRLSSGFAALCICFSASLSVAQQLADSLQQALRSAKGEERVDILNKLTYEFISVDNEKVNLYNDEAIELAGSIGYTRGQALAYAYRGVVEYQSGQFREARRDLHIGRRLARTASDRTTEGYTLLQLGNLGLEEVNTDSAGTYLRRAYEVFKDSTHPENLSKVYRNLSALSGQRMQPDSQQYFLDKAIAIRRLLPDRSYLVDALAIQANNKRASGSIPAAEALLDEAERILKDYPNDLENFNDVKHVRALILFQRGDFHAASALVDSARNYYLRMSLFRKYVTLLTDLGGIFSLRGEYEIALNNLYDALRLSTLKGFETETYIIRTRIGWINFQLGDYAQALRLANETLQSRPKKLLKADLANALTLKGVVATDLNMLTEARTALDTVRMLHEEAGNVQGLSEAYMNLGAVESRMGNYAKALDLYTKSITLADSSGYIFGLAWSNWGIADIFFQQKRFNDANSFLDKSEQLAKQLHANELLILGYNTRRDVLRATGRYQEALEYAIRATQLKDSVRRGDLARRFANLEKIEEIERRDRDIRVLQQEKQLAEDVISLQESRLNQLYLGVFASLVIIALLVFIYFRVRKLNITILDKNNSIQQQSAELMDMNDELNRLYKEVSEKNEEIQAQTQELSEINRMVTDANKGLEQAIAEKTIELRKTNEELIKHNNELLQFSYTVSHNLRGPVARLLGLAGLMQKEEDVEQAKRIVDLVGNTAGELDLIIKDLSKILELRRHPQHLRDHVDLQAEWEQSVRLLGDNMDGSEKITCDFQKLPQVATVRSMVQSVFYNLISNALKFRAAERPLHIHASSDVNGEYAHIKVSDNGIGLNTELYREKLFRLYTRFHTHVEGRGIGLYLIKSQLEVVHGSISVQSSPGEGTTFDVAIPLVAELETLKIS